MKRFKTSICIQSPRLVGSTLICLGLFANKFVLERILATDGRLSSRVLTTSILLLQVSTLALGVFTYIKRLAISISFRKLAVLIVLGFSAYSSARTFLPQVGYLDDILSSGYRPDDR